MDSQIFTISCATFFGIIYLVIGICGLIKYYRAESVEATVTEYVGTSHKGRVLYHVYNIKYIHGSMQYSTEFMMQSKKNVGDTIEVRCIKTNKGVETIRSNFNQISIWEIALGIIVLFLDIIYVRGVL